MTSGVGIVSDNLRHSVACLYCYEQFGSHGTRIMDRDRGPKQSQTSEETETGSVSKLINTLGSLEASPA
jgi:hypothetical protein